MESNVLQAEGGAVFNIEQPRRYQLERPPLTQVLAQIRFPLVAHFQELSGIAGIQDSLFDLFPYMDRQQVLQLTLAVGLASNVPAPPETAGVWRFTGDDGWTFVLEPGSAALVASGADYFGIEDFTRRFSRVLHTLSQTQRIRRCDRLGVRYINIVESPPSQERTWSRWFRPELIGWIGSALLASDTRLQSSVTLSQLTAKPTGPFAGVPADVQALIRHGVIPSGTEIPLVDVSPPRRVEHESYVLDLDLFIQAPQHFAPEAVLEQFTALHTQIDGFFRWALTEEGERYFGVLER